MVSKVARFSALAALAALSLLPAAAGALTFVKATDEYLVDHAPVIVRAVARPALRESAPDEVPTTLYLLEVKTALRGAAVGQVLELEIPGGRDAAGFEAVFFGAPRLSPGEEALFFLEGEGHGRLRILHFHQGIFRLSLLQTRRAAWRDFGDSTEIAIAGRAAVEERPRDLGRFEAWIARRLAGKSGAPDYWLPSAAGGGLETAAAKFTLYDYDDERPVRWPKSTAALDLTYFAHQAPQPGVAGGGYGEVETALGAWNALLPGALRLRYGGQTGSAAGFNSRDGLNSIVFDNYANARGIVRPFDCEANTGVLANGRAWVSEVGQYAGREFRTVIEGDVVVNENLECWRDLTNSSFLRVLAHEVGHTLGLGHSCGEDGSPCDTPAKNQAIMRAFLGGTGPLGAAMSDDDRMGIGFLYAAPAAPGFLAAEVDHRRRVQLFWGDASDNESGFAVYRELSGAREQIGWAGAGVRRFDDDSAQPATTYRYSVRAVNDNGSSAAAETIVTTPALDAPDQLAATATGPHSVSLAWVDQAGNETGYEVWGGFTGTEELLASLPANSQAAAIGDLIADTDYRFKVRATGMPTGNTAFSNLAQATTLPAPIEPCAENGGVTCLQANRFKIEVRWKDFQGVRGSAQVAPAGSADSGIFYFFSPNNWEMLVKVLDGCAINGHQWVFAAGTTNVETTLIVTDSETGKTAVYFNPLGTPAPAVTDIEAFAGCGGEASTALVKTATPQAMAPLCQDGSGNLCLLGGRYRVRVTWTDFAAQSGPGRPVAAGTADSGLLYFFSPDNWEMLVKVLDGCAINRKVWVFAAATTNVAYDLEITDTETGATKTYSNPLGQSSAAIGDVEAFAGCPD